MKHQRAEVDLLAERLIRNNLEFSEDQVRRSLEDESFLRLDAVQNAWRCLRIRDIVARLAASGRGHSPGDFAVLEIGIGYGYVTSCLRQGLDPSVAIHAVEHPSREYLGRPAFQEYLARNHIQFRPCDFLAEELPWPDVKFNAIIFSEVLEHLPPTKAPDLIRQLAHRLSPDGRLIVTSPNLHSLHRRIHFLLGRGRIFDLAVPLDFAPGTYGHIMLYGREELRALLAHAGLELEEFGYLNWEHIYLRGGGIGARILHWMQAHGARLVPQFSTTWVAVAAPARPTQ